MPRKKQDQPQRLGLQSHGDKAPAEDTVTVEPVEEEMSCVSDTEERTHPSSPKPPPSLVPTSASSPTPLISTATPTPTSSSMVVQDRGSGLGLGQDLGGGLGLIQDTMDNPLDKDLSLSSILALLCGGNPLQGLGRELASSPPCALEPRVTTLGGEGRMKGGGRGGEEEDKLELEAWGGGEKLGEKCVSTDVALHYCER